MSGASEMAMGVFETDHRCTHCGYNLRGLARGGRCPECGTVARLSRSATYGHTPMVDVSKRYLHWLSIGLSMLGMTFGAPLALLLASWIVPIPGGLFYFLLVVALAAWPVGTVLVLMPRPVKENAGAGLLGREWLVLRGLVAVTQIGALGLFLGLAIVAEVTGSTIIDAFALGFLVLTVLGWSALCAYLGQLAWWGDDDRAQGWLLNSAWAIGIGGPSALICYGMMKLTGGVLFVILAAPFVLCLVFGTVGMVLMLFSLASTVRWAIRNAESARARDARMAEKQRREEEEQMARHAAAAPTVTPEQEALAREVLAKDQGGEGRAPSSGAGSHPHARQGIVIDRTDDSDIYSLEDDEEREGGGRRK